MIKALPPIIHRDAYNRGIERRLIEWFGEVIFEPLFGILRDAGIEWDWKKYKAIKFDELGRQNAADGAIKEALRSGRIWYDEGAFRGEFNAAISRELKHLGARIVPGQLGASFRIEYSALPFDIRSTIGETKQKVEKLQDQIGMTLAEMDRNIIASPTLGIDFKKPITEILGDLQNQFIKTTTSVEDIEIPMEMTPAIAKTIEETHTANMDLYIKGFSHEMIADLRTRVMQNTQAGYRPARLAQIIEAQYGVSKRKAAFLAEQETSLLVSKFREEEYKAIGCNLYRWSTSHDERVRDSHRILQNKVFSWDDPPLIAGTNRYCNPGEDFRCLPGDSRVNFVNGIKKAFRRWYAGELTTLVFESGETLRATSNHPVLTLRGWKAISLIDQTDEIVQVRSDHFLSTELDHDQAIPTISDIFETLRESGLGFTFPGKAGQFHGDGSDADVDVVRTAGPLILRRETCIAQGLKNLCLSMADFLASSLSGFNQLRQSLLPGQSLRSSMGRLCQSLPFIHAQSRHADSVRFGTRSDRNTSFDQSPPDDDSPYARPFGDGKLTLSSDVSVDDGFWVKLKAVPGFSVARIKDTSSEFFRGHVFNLETEDGYYATGNVIVSNCRCVAVALVNLSTD